MPKTIQAVEQAANLKIYTPQLDRLEKKLLEWEEQNQFQTLVIKATRYGVPIFEGCYGMNTKEYGVKMDLIFPVASITKTVIATLLMILQEEGCIELEKPVSRYIPEYVGGGKEKISLWHFLTHTSGIIDGEFYNTANEYVKDELKIERPDNNASQDDWNDYNSKIKKALELPDDFNDDKLWNIILYRGGTVQHEPRKVMSYCSHGFQMLKEVICAVTGESIDAYARRVLFDPLGMVDSHWIVPEEKWHRILGRGEHCEGYPWINSERNYTSESGGGGLKTTVNDMTNFAQMILGGGRYNNHRILSPASVRQMTANYNIDFPNLWDAWSLGWNYRGAKVDDAGTLRSKGAVEHGGFAWHRILVDPEYDLSVITNTAEYGYPDFFPYWGTVNNMIIAACE